MAEITIKISYSERITFREVLRMVKAGLPEPFEVVAEKAEFSVYTSDGWVAREDVALADEKHLEIDQLELFENWARGEGFHLSPGIHRDYESSKLNWMRRAYQKGWLDSKHKG